MYKRLGPLLGISVFCWTLVSCTHGSTSDSEAEGTARRDPCVIAQKVDQLTNPINANQANEDAFYQLAREDGVMGPRSDVGRLGTNLDAFESKLNEPACQKVGDLCKLALIGKKWQNFVHTMNYLPYAGTLKLREMGGRERVLVKGRAVVPPAMDPRQSDGVARRYQNSYVWAFREKAGDLHPGFLLAALEGQEPFLMDTTLFEGAGLSHRRDPLGQTYARVEALHQYLVKNGYLQRVDRDGEDAIQDLYLVNPAKIRNLAVDSGLNKKISSLFGAKSDQMRRLLPDLMSSRIHPILKANAKGKYEITQEVLAAMGREVPWVSIRGGIVQCLDHHRIMAAYDLGMAIEVHPIYDVISFN